MIFRFAKPVIVVGVLRQGRRQLSVHVKAVRMEKGPPQSWGADVGTPWNPRRGIVRHIADSMRPSAAPWRLTFRWQRKRFTGRAVVSVMTLRGRVLDLTLAGWDALVMKS